MPQCLPPSAADSNAIEITRAARVRLADIDIRQAPRAGLSITMGNASQIELSNVRVEAVGGAGLIAPDPSAQLPRSATLDVRGLHVLNSSGPAVTVIALPSVTLADIVARNTSGDASALGRVLWLERIGWCAVRGVVVETEADAHVGFYDVASGALSDVAWRPLGGRVTVQRVNADGVTVAGGSMLAPAAPVAPGAIVANATTLAKDLQEIVGALLAAGVLAPPANVSRPGRAVD